MGLLAMKETETPVVTADGTVAPTAPSLLGIGDWRQAFSSPQIPQPIMPASPYMQQTMVGNTPTYGIDPMAFEGLLASLMPVAQPAQAPAAPVGLLAPDTPIQQAVRRKMATNFQLFGSSADRGYAR